MEPLNPATDGASANIVDENLAKLRELFPDAFTESSEDGEPRWKVDFDALREVLGDAIEDKPERYSFTWNGKSRAKLIANTPTTATLRPCPEESVNWDTTKNLFIEGDNLEVLKLLQKSYHRKVKMIYIDPPYNTGNEFIYPDKFQDNLDTYLRYSGQVDDGGLKLSTNAETGGRFHTNWLNMMYPRLRLARSLLRDDGVLFVSIGDNEESNLKALCNEVFGEEACLGTVTRVAKKTSNKGTYFAPSKDYVLAYARMPELIQPFMDAVDEAYASRFKETDDRGAFATVGLYQAALDPMRGCSNQRYWVRCPDGSYAIPPGETFPAAVEDASNRSPESRNDKVWRWSFKSYLEKKELLVFKETPKSPLVKPDGSRSPWNVYTKYYLEDRLKDGLRPRDYLDDLTNDLGTAALKRLDLDDYFDFAKPPELIQRLMTWLSDDDGIVLDFFAGSGSTAEAVMEQNAGDGGARKFILVQLPEPCPENSIAHGAGYSNIADIARERVSRVVQRQLKQRDELLSSGVDVDTLGFRFFRLASSSIQPWDADFDTVEETLLDSIDNIKPERTESDVLYELLLKYGLNLTEPIEEREIAGSTIFSVGAGALVVCLASSTGLDVVEGIVSLKEELKPEVMRVVFRDSGFKDDVVKANAVQILKQAGLADEQIRSL